MEKERGKKADEVGKGEAASERERDGVTEKRSDGNGVKQDVEKGDKGERSSSREWKGFCDGSKGV